MGDDRPAVELAKRTVVLELPGMEAVHVRRDLPFRVAGDGAELTLDVYRPHGASDGTRAPAVLFVTGYSDAGVQAVFGCRAKEMGAYVSWARLAAASGLAGVTYVSAQPAEDARAALDHVRRHADALGIDGDRIALWSCSGNVPNAVSLLMEEAPGCVRCAALCYGYMLDLDGSTAVAEASAAFRFVNPAAGRPRTCRPTCRCSSPGPDGTRCHASTRRSTVSCSRRCASTSQSPWRTTGRDRTRSTSPTTARRRAGSSGRSSASS